MLAEMTDLTNLLTFLPLFLHHKCSSILFWVFSSVVIKDG